MLFFVYAFYCSAGAMVISNASDIMRVQSGGEEGPYGAIVKTLVSVMVVVASISNATGRSLGGILSDKIGRKPTYYIIHTVQALNMAMFHFYTTPTMIFIGTIITCVAYGTVMSTTPSIVADYLGSEILWRKLWHCVHWLGSFVDHWPYYCAVLQKICDSEWS